MKNNFLKNNSDNKRAFSLVENIVVIVVTSLIILITVPNVIQQRTIKQNQIFVRKSITLYSNILNKYLVKSTAIRNKAALNSKVLGNDNNCEPIRNELNVRDIQADSSCKFATADGIKWNFLQNGNVIIGLKKATFENDQPNSITLTKAADSENLQVFLIPYDLVCINSTSDCSIQMLFIDEGADDDVKNAVEKTRNFIVGE